MALMQALALLAGGAAGYQQRKRDDKADARQDEKDAWERERRDRERQSWKQQDQDRAEQRAERARMVEAAAPVEAKPELTPGMHGPQTWGVAGKTITDDRQVPGAVRAANMPSAVMSRMAGATSDPQAAINLRAASTKAGLDEATQARQDKMLDIVGALASGGIAAIPEVYSRYNDGYDAEVIPGQNGGFVVRRMKDGKPAGEVPFKDMEDFVVRAVGSMNPDMYVTSMQKRREQEARDAQAAAELQFRRDTLAETGRHNRSMEGIGRMRAAGDAQQPQPVGVNMDDADKFIATFFTAKDEMTGRATFDPVGAQAIRELMLRMPAARAGDTQGAVNQAMAMYQAAMQTAKGDHAKAMQAIQASIAPPKTPEPAAPAPAPAPKADNKRTTAPAPERNSRYTLRAPVQQLTRAELISIKPGHPSYIPAQEELARRAASMAEQAAAQGNFDPGY